MPNDFEELGVERRVLEFPASLLLATKCHWYCARIGSDQMNITPHTETANQHADRISRAILESEVIVTFLSCGEAGTTYVHIGLDKPQPQRDREPAALEFISKLS